MSWRAVAWLALCVLLLLGCLGAYAVRVGWHKRAYDVLLYSVITQRVVAGSTSQQESAERLAAYVFANVAQPVDAPIIDDASADVLVRGFGYCDQAVFAFVRLLQEVGIRGRVLELRVADGTSPHTVAEVYLDGQWRVFDVFYNFIPHNADGSIATREDLLAHPELLDESRALPEWYRDATVFSEPAPPSDGWRGRAWWLGQDLVRVLPAGVIDRAQDVYLLLPKPTYRAYNYGPQGATASVYEDFSTADARLFFQARNEHLFGRGRDAARDYAALVRTYPRSAHADQARYELGRLQLYQAQAPDRAVQTLERLMASQPPTPWKDEAQHVAAQAYDALGDCPRAASLFGQLATGTSPDAEDAQARRARLPCV